VQPGLLEEFTMKNTPKHRAISRMRLSAANAALAFAAVLLPAVIAAQSPEAQTFAVIHSFVTADGPKPEQGGLIQGVNGDLWGTTQYGGVSSSGSVFKMTLDGKLTTMYNFCSPPEEGNCVLGLAPGALVLGTNGDIYGVSEYGGLSGSGILFKTISSSGETVGLGDFQVLEPPNETNGTGANPVGALVEAADGKFWGVAQYGGQLGQGTKFEVGPRGSLGSAVSFGCIEPNCNNGFLVAGGLGLGADGNFYGTTESGGTGAFGGGPGGVQYGGAVFSITPSGTVTTIYSFCSLSDCTDGQAPTGALVQGADGNFYGTTFYGGAGTACFNPHPGVLGCGTVFEITPGGTLTTLHSFCMQSGCLDGQNPSTGLTLGSDGNLYGTTSNGGSAPSAHCSDNPCGTIFEVSTPSGPLTTLYSFCVKGEQCTTGGGPVAPLMQDTNGDFYGTTTTGGNSSSGNGTVFRLSTGLASGAVGAAVKILGTGLTGATSVTFNGTAATFTVVLGSEITTTVPAGATSGAVQVTTPNGTLSSNGSFVVTP